MSGANDEETAIQIARSVSGELNKGCFKLRKWLSNSPKVVESIEPESSNNFVKFGESEYNKTLGLLWSSKTDQFSYDINSSKHSNISKRTILSDIAQVFDPLGLVSPCTIIAKMLLQKLWLEKVSWDESLPASIHSEWVCYRGELDSLNKIKIDRHIVCADVRNVHIHGFSDASKNAYAACVYLLSENKKGDIKTRLICAKTKVAPLKTLSIPRLELCGALLLANLVKKVKDALNLDLDGVTYWCDSTVVLGWLNHSPSSLEVFVGNRISKIQTLTNVLNWRYVPSKLNPADHATRGISPKDLAFLNIWWDGPEFLRQTKDTWPKLEFGNVTLPDLNESNEISLLTVHSADSFFERYSNLSFLERAIAFVLRFKNNCLKSEKLSGPLKVFEINNATMLLVRLAQSESFEFEIKLLSTGKPLPNNSKILQLSPFIDKDRILRVGGRLKNSNYEFDKKHPILLSDKHKFTMLLLEKLHVELKHAGPQHMLYIAREQFWPLNGRNLARKIVHKCTKCFRAKPRVITPVMGELPEGRLHVDYPFSSTGCDYGGPFFVKDRKGRGRKVTKAYLCLFVCFVTRAVHLELVSDLSTEGFLAALKRFIARRGRPGNIYSDNGKNFIGASSKLKELGQFLLDENEGLTRDIQGQGVDWKFIPAYSPHFGGLWEAGIKSVKYHIKRVAANAILTYEQFYTLLVQIEGILNSRPISPMSSDPSDFLPLSPSHFLIGRSNHSIPAPDLTHLPENRLSQFERIEQLKQHFWTRWAKEYVSEMQIRTKWKAGKGDLKLNTLVLIKEDNQPSTRWLLGRVVSLFPGKDGVARVATIQTTNGIIKRAFSKICPLPLSTEESSTTPQRQKAEF